MTVQPSARNNRLTSKSRWTFLAIFVLQNSAFAFGATP
jgi:hypothetical protein